jgi:hypothetical protein
MLMDVINTLQNLMYTMAEKAREEMSVQVRPLHLRQHAVDRKLLTMGHRFRE